MLFQFDGEVATTYGVDEAILFHHIAYWVYVNEASERNFLEGRYWTYNSGKAYEKLFPFWKDRQIRNKLQHMVDEGLILKGSFSNNRYDHTCWYTLSDMGKTISQNLIFDWTKFTNRADEKDQSIHILNNNIPIVTNNIPNIYMSQKPQNAKSRNVKDNPPTLEEVRAYCIERDNEVNAEKFLNFYEANGWVQGKGSKPIVNWKAAVRTWEQSQKKGMSEIDRKQRASYTEESNPFT